MRLRSARATTAESKPALSTPAHQTPPAVRPRSMRRVRPRAITATAAAGSEGSPSTPARSLPPPAGTMPSGTSVPASACTAQCTSPSPPTAPTAATPGAPASPLTRTDPRPDPPASTSTSSPCAASAARTGPASRAARPRPARGLASSAPVSAMPAPYFPRPACGRRKHDLGRVARVERVFDIPLRSTAGPPRPQDVDDSELVELIQAWERLSSWAAAGQLAAIAELARRRPRSIEDGHGSAGDAGDPLVPQVSGFAVDEVAAALRLSRPAAGARVHLAVELTRLPATTAALAADPAAAERRHERAVPSRQVALQPSRDGMAELWALLPADAAVAVYQQIDAAARRAGADDTRSRDARRADALVAAVLGTASGAAATPAV